MSDLDPNAQAAVAPETPPAPPPAPAPSPSSQQQTQQTPNNDAPDLSRRLAAMDGYKSVADPLIRAGYKDPNQILELIERGKRAETPAQPVQATPSETGPRPLTEADLPRLTSSFVSELDKRESMAQHNAAIASQESATAQAAQALSGRFGDSPLVTLALQQAIQKREALYPVGHPLRDVEIRPPTADQIAEAVKEAEQTLAALAGAGLRQDAADALANAGRASGALEPSGGAGSDRPFWDLPQAEKEAMAKRIQEQTLAARQAALRPMSTA